MAPRPIRRHSRSRRAVGREIGESRRLGIGESLAAHERDVRGSNRVGPAREGEARFGGEELTGPGSFHVSTQPDREIHGHTTVAVPRAGMAKEYEGRE